MCNHSWETFKSVAVSCVKQVSDVPACVFQYFCNSSPSLALIPSSRIQKFSAYPCNHSKQNWMNYPLWKKLLKLWSSWGVARQRESTGSHLNSGKKDQHYTVNSTNSLSVVGSRAIFQVISAMPHHHPFVQKQGRKVRFLQLSEDHCFPLQKKSLLVCS